MAELSAMSAPDSPRRGERRRPLPEGVRRGLLALAAHAAPWSIVITDAEGNILAANEVAASVLGYSLDEFQALNIIDTCALDRVSAASEVFAELVGTGHVGGVGPALRRDGAQVMVRYAGRKLELDGRVFYVFVSFPVRVVGASTPQASGRGARRHAEITRREREILVLVGDGYENDQIARRLHLSVNTVKTYVQRVLAKLHAQSRAHAVALAIRNGLID